MDQKKNYQNDGNGREFSTAGRHSSTPYSAAPFIVYRSAKYFGLRARTLGYMTNARTYLKHPTLLKWVSKLATLFYNTALVLLLIAAIPCLLVLFCAIQLFRKLQSTLVKRYYPDAIICDDFSPRKSPSSCIESDIVTSLIWVKGHLDLDRIKSSLDNRIRAPSSPLYLLCHVLRSRFRILVWESESQSLPEDAISTTDATHKSFKIDNHISQAPSKFHEFLVTDQPLRELSGGSVLQRYVSTLVSSPFPSKSCSPWGITLISLPASGTSSHQMGHKSSPNTLVVLRFHRLLLREKAVVGMFLSSLGQEGALEVETDGLHQGQGQLIPCELDFKGQQGYGQGSSICKEESNQQEKCWKDKSRMFLESMSQGLESFILDCDSWITLRQRQAEFHSRLAIGKLLFSEFSDNLSTKSVQLLEGFSIFKQYSFSLFQILCGLVYAPKILFKICLTNRSLGRVGLFRRKTAEMTTTNVKSISWSKQMSTQFLEEISAKLETGEGESVVFLTAVSLALKDYYQENCIQNPGKLGASISSSCSSSRSSSPYGTKLVELPTRICDISKELNNLEEQVHSFTAWKQLGLFYLTKFSSLFLPGWISHFLVVQKLGEFYPVHLTLVDTNSSFPHLTFWGHPVQEFTFWRPPQSNLCISITLIKYGGTFRLAVSSPMKSVDPFISQRFPQYLNQIAESVGLERVRIPYSRKSSPFSSSSSSPDGAGDENDGENDGSVFITDSKSSSSCSIRRQISLDSKILSKLKSSSKLQLVKRFNSCRTIR